MIARNEQLERYDGKFVAMNRKYRDRSKYDRKEAKRELRRDLRGSYCICMSMVYEENGNQLQPLLHDYS